MEKDIGIGVTFEAPFVGNGHAAKDEGSSWDEGMNIITKANAQHVLNMRGRRVRAKVFPSSSWQLLADSLGERDALSVSLP
jgi:hypothetical protein